MKLNNGYEPLGVATAELAPWVEKAIQEHDANHTDGLSQLGNGGNRAFGATAWISQESGLNEKMVRNIRYQKTKFTTLTNADRLLTAIGYSHLLSSGQVRVIPNPNLSQEKWMQMLADRGCEPEDFGS